MVPRPYQSATASHSMPLPRGVPESLTVNTIPSNNPRLVVISLEQIGQPYQSYAGNQPFKTVSSTFPSYY